MRAALILPALLVVGCTRTPVVHVDARRLDGARPPQQLLRCRAEGLAAPVHYQWRFSPSVKQVGWGAPADEPTALVQLADGATWVECTASTADNKVAVKATRSLAPPRISAAPATARPGELVTVRGSGFGPVRNIDDQLYFVPAWGAAQAANHACKGAGWAEGAVSACVPAALRPGAWQLRVQTAGELAIAVAPLTVRP